MRHYLFNLIAIVALCATPYVALGQQNDPDGDKELNPTPQAPAFGTWIDYSDARFQAKNLSRSDYASYPQITNLPTLYINIEQGWDNNSYIDKTKEYYEATITVIDKSGQMKQRDEAVGLRGRGNSTWRLSMKKPFRLKFASKTKLLATYDMQAGKEVNDYANAKSWVLISNNFDRTMVRNGLTNQLMKHLNETPHAADGSYLTDQMPFVPACQYVDLVFQGEYWGTYQISDQVQVDTKRINIDNDGWFVEYVWNENGLVEQPCIKLDGQICVNIKAPESDLNIVDDPNFDGTFYGPFTTEPKYDTMKGVLAAFHDAILMNAQGYTSSYWQQYLDMPNFIDWFLTMDIAANWDGCYGNDYLYRNSWDGYFDAGPVWDLDLGYGNYGDMGPADHFWRQEKGIYKSILAMQNDPHFVKMLVERWRELYDNGQLSTWMINTARTLANQIEASRILNYSKASSSARYEWERTGWNINSIKGIDAHAYENYDKAFSALTDYITKHTAALHSYYENLYTSLHCSNLGEPRYDEPMPVLDAAVSGMDIPADARPDKISDKPQSGGGDITEDHGDRDLLKSETHDLNTSHGGMTVQISGSWFDANAQYAEILVSGKASWNNLIKVNNANEEWGTTVASSKSYQLSGQQLQWGKDNLLRLQADAAVTVVINSYGTLNSDSGNNTPDNGNQEVEDPDEDPLPVTGSYPYRQIGKNRAMALALSGSGDRKLIPSDLMEPNADRLEIRVSGIEGNDKWANILTHRDSWEESYKNPHTRKDESYVYFDVYRGTDLYNQLYSNNGYLQSASAVTIRVRSFVKGEACTKHTYAEPTLMAYGWGTYVGARVCTQCGHVEAGEKYYSFTVYNADGSVKQQEVTTDINWGATYAEHNPNQLVFTETPGIEGINVVSNNVCSELVITDGYPFHSTTTFYARKATYQRNVSNHWGTLCLPFKIDTKKSQNVKFYTLSEVEMNGEDGRMEFAEATSVGGMTPLLLRRTGDDTMVTIVGSAQKDNGLITIKPYAPYTKNVSSETAANVPGWNLYGNVGETVTLSSEPGVERYYIAGDQFWHSVKSFTLGAFRAYFETTGSAPARIRISDNEADGIDQILTDQPFEFTIFDINGQLIHRSGEPAEMQHLGLQPGIYIINGQKTILR